jgi:N-acetylmuramoyl-L-alanine amidase
MLSNGLAALAIAAAFAPASAAELVGVRFGVTSPTATRVVLDLTGGPDYALEAESAGAGRLMVSIAGQAPGKALPLGGKGAGQVAAYAASAIGGGSRVTFDLKSPSKIKEIIVIPASAANPRHRLVIDLTSAKPGDLIASLPAKKFETLTEVIAEVAPPQKVAASPTEPLMGTVPAPPTLAAYRRPPTIVIDAGHGGTDPGAGGPAGGQESVATLSAATALAEILEESGRYEVILTRSTDTRLAHEERSRIARDARADLFISLHADAHADSKVRGGSVYTLSDEGTVRSAKEALAKGNYQVFDLDIGEEAPEVGGILYDLVQRRTENESDKFAELLIGKLAGVTPLLNNTHRRGNFKVLLAPDVPAVLLELAFISNKHDEANLGSVAWRKRTMGAVAGAIDAYFEQRVATKHASNSSQAAPR